MRCLTQDKATLMLNCYDTFVCEVEAMLQGIDRLVDLVGVRSSGRSATDSIDVGAAVSVSDIDTLAKTTGQWAAVGREGNTVRLARTMGIPLRYFVAKMFHGPFLIVSDRIDSLYDWCVEHKIGWQFDPLYTRMVPAHYLLEIDQIGCPDPSPRYHRFFSPPVGTGDASVASCGQRYVNAAAAALKNWLHTVPLDAQIGLAYSGGIDSTSLWLLARQLLADMGGNPDNILAFTLDLGGGKDAVQAREIANQLNLTRQHIVVTASPDEINLNETIAIIEDYHPLDVQCAASALCLLKHIRNDYPNLKYLLDGDGGDENLKDYPLEDSDLTLSSVLRNPLLYQEGWGVDAIKHSLTYTGGLSRSYVRSFAPAAYYGFTAYSPYVSREAIEAACAIPFDVLLDGSIERLYTLKSEVVTAGIKAATGIDMPSAPKRRFQDGIGGDNYRDWRVSKAWCRQVFIKQWESRLSAAWDPAADRLSGNDLSAPVPERAK